MTRPRGLAAASRETRSQNWHEDVACRVCPVQLQCLAWALGNAVADGVWAGITPDGRRVIRSLSRRKAKAISKEHDGDKSYHPAEHGDMEYVRKLLRGSSPDSPPRWNWP